MPDSYVQELRDEIEETIDRIARERFDGGAIEDLCEGHGVETRLVHLNRQDN
ncbi:MAG: hypothetical protein QF886_25860 [Planctomycetota bacterium]|nr:hypothetical protein [Planctomycetota bacterium]